MKKIYLLFTFLCLVLLCGCSAKQCLVVYNLNGGTLVSGDMMQYVDVEGNATPPVVEREGYVFSWDKESKNIQGDTIISANWEKKEFDVTFELNGGTLNSGNLAQKVKWGEAAIAPEVSKEGMALSWNADFSCITENLTVTAVWEPRVFNVTFKLNGGELISGDVTQKVEKGNDATAPKVSMDGMELSWDIDFCRITEDLTVNAIWTRKAMSGDELAAYALERSAVIYCDKEAAGTGFFIDGNGILVTNFHVIEGAEDITVELHSGAKYDLKELVSFSPSLDLAVLKIDCKTPYFDLNKDVAKVGTPVYTVGTSLGFLKCSFTSGVISSNSRNLGKIECYQMDAPISPGNSGGPLINQYGEVIGVSSYSYTRGNDLHLAIKISELNKLVKKNLSTKEYREWYSTETGHSYSPYEYVSHYSEYDYYYSLINTYQHVTDVKCEMSWDNEDSKWLNGYHDCCNAYAYTYDKKNYDKYIEYIKDIGFEFDSETSISGYQNLTYYSLLDNIYIDFYFYTANNELWISVYY